MWAWISSFLPFCLICYYICDELIPYLTLEIRHFCHKNQRIPHCFLKHITYNILSQSEHICAPRANFGGNYAHFYQFNAHIILKIGHYFVNGPLFWKWVIILKICHYFENGSKFWKWVKFWELGKNLKIDQKFENW